jgi:hypothetical protein
MKRNLSIALVTVAALVTCANLSVAQIVQPAPPAQPAPPPQPVLPDLQMSGLSIASPAVLHCGTQTVTYTVTDLNAGAAPAGRHYVDLRYSSGGGFNPINRRLWVALNPGVTNTQTFTFSFWNGPCDCLPSTYTATFQAATDTLSSVAESNESNNLSNTVSIPAACP